MPYFALSSSTSNVLSGDKKAAHFSRWNEALSDQVWDRFKFFAFYLIIQVLRKGLKRELSYAFAEFFKSRANITRAPN